MIKRILVKFLAKICIKILKSGKSTNSKSSYCNETTYSNWRSSELNQQLIDNFDLSRIENRAILDFGSGRGELSIFLAKNFRPEKIYAIEMNEGLINYSRSLIDKNGLREKIEIVKGGIDRIPLPDECVDIIFCFDTLEHIVSIKNILEEWHRMLKQNGFIYIWWSAWPHPWGSHMSFLVPIPWLHLFIGEEMFCEIANEVYKNPDYDHKMWDYDGDGKLMAEKKHQLFSWLNKLWPYQFKSMLDKIHLFEIKQFEKVGFKLKFAKLTRSLVNVPILGDIFTSFILIELKKV